MFIMLRMYVPVLFFVLMCQGGTPFYVKPIATVCVHVSIRDIVYVIWMFLSIIVVIQKGMTRLTLQPMLVFESSE